MAKRARDNAPTPPVSREVNFSAKATVVILLVVAAILLGTLIMWKFAAGERARSLKSWQVRMALVADNQLTAVDQWIERQYGALSALSDNASLQLYLTTLADTPTEKVADSAELTFLRNLLTVTAEKNGFYVPQPSEEIDANVKPLAVSGIAIVDAEGKMLGATRSMPPLEGALEAFVKNVPAGKRALTDIYVGNNGIPVMAFYMPVFAIQGDREPSSQVGAIVGVREVGDLFKLLEPPTNYIETAETMLVRERGKVVDYISPLMDGTAALTRQLDATTPNLESAFAVERPGGFAIKNDYRLKEVLVTGRNVPDTGWTLVHKVDAKEALSESNARRIRIILFFALGTLVVVVLVVAAWKHGSSLRNAHEATKYRKLSEELKSEKELLKLVTDNQPGAMYIVDKEDRYCFSNLEASVRAGVAMKDISGKTLESVLGPAKADVYKDKNAEALNNFQTVRQVQKFEGKFMQSRHIPIRSVPSVIAHKDTPGVLIVEQDITDVVREREKREQTLRQVVDALVTAVDKRDPYAHNHSAKVAQMAKGVAEEMHLDQDTIEATETAGRLMNIGKLSLPQELLTKKGKLSDEERKTLNASFYASADFLKGIEFRGPVVETLRQCKENWDGSGPRGLKAEKILISARIIAVANAFIAMVSPRAYRPSIKRKDAIEFIMKEMNTLYDRNVVVGLVNYLENRCKNDSWWEKRA